MIKENWFLEKRWLSSFYTYWGFYLLVAFATIFETPESDNIWWARAIIFRAVIWMPLIYKHAFKEYGEKLLLCVIFFLGLSSLQSILNIANYTTGYEKISSVILSLVEGWFFFESILLAKRNDKFKKQISVMEAK